MKNDVDRTEIVNELIGCMSTFTESLENAITQLEANHNRAPDDFQPRAQLRKLLVEENIKCGDNDKIEKFSKKYIVSPDLVKEYLEHLTNIEVRKNMRKEEKRQVKKDEQTKGYGDYNWEELYKSRNLKKLKVAELNKRIFSTTYQGENCPNPKNLIFY